MAPSELTNALPLGFEQWGAIPQAAALGLATFVQEDLPTITAAVLAGARRLDLWTGFLGCFLGIWMGDLLLYGVARAFGRPLLEVSWARRWIREESIQRSERWFAEKGSWLLVSSRFVPGTRLPTYLAAGFLRVPFQRFAGLTAGVVAFWTAAIFLLAHQFGAGLARWAQRWSHAGLILAGGVGALFGLVYLAQRLLRRESRRRIQAWLGRLTRWEFWPAGIFYLPVIVHYIRLAIRHGGLLVPSAANPGIVTGGLVSESKAAILESLSRGSPAFTAEAHLIGPGEHPERWDRLQYLMAHFQIAFPFILKPDVGQRGAGVKIIRSEADASAYLRQTAEPIILQRYAPGPFEIGVFYYRFPSEKQGRIFAITEKIFPTLTGDGKQTIEELIWNDARARFAAGRYLERFASRRQEVLPAGETLRLVEAGNHAQGCIFRDGARYRTPELEAQIDRISQGVEGFYIGRYDIRFSSEEELAAGRNFQIVELNGAAAEATSIYDARNSLWQAYRTLFQQWNLVFAIGAANRRRGAQPTPVREMLRRWRGARLAMASYPVAD